jgi:hypothetical protein
MAAVNTGDLLQELFGRVGEHVEEAVDGLDTTELTATVAPGTNPIGWLVWHLTRVQDDHVADLLDQPQIWVTDDVGRNFGVASDPDNTGYGHGPDDVATIRPVDVAALLDYYRVVAARTADLVAGVTDDELDRVVDERWDPPVTLGVRLVSIADDDIQHAGQATYLRGLLSAGR